MIEIFVISLLLFWPSRQYTFKVRFFKLQFTPQRTPILWLIDFQHYSTIERPIHDFKSIKMERFSVFYPSIHDTRTFNRLCTFTNLRCGSIKYRVWKKKPEEGIDLYCTWKNLNTMVIFLLCISFLRYMVSMPTNEGARGEGGMPRTWKFTELRMYARISERH